MTGGRREPREFGSAEEVAEFIDGVRARNRATIDRYEAYLEQTGGLTGEGFSADGAVRAEVDENGLVSTVDIPDSSLRHGSRLAGMVLAAIREAQAERALKLADLGRTLGGPDTSGMVAEAVPEHVRENVEQRRERRR